MYHKIYFCLKEAWINTVKLSTVVNAFRCAGIWPVNSDVVRQKVLPSTVYSKSQLAVNEVPDRKEVKCDNPELKVLESVLSSGSLNVDTRKGSMWEMVSYMWYGPS